MNNKRFSNQVKSWSYKGIINSFFTVLNGRTIQPFFALLGSEVKSQNFSFVSLYVGNKRTKQGFTILIAVVAASILLVVAMAIADISLKEQVLSTSGRDSQIAFYAADSGIECALYWDQKKGVFSARDTDGNAVSSAAFSCNGATVKQPSNPTQPITVPGGDQSVSFLIQNIESLPSGACAIVTVTKDTSDPNKTKTYIDSRGYNTCDPSLRRIERGIDAHY